MKRELVISVLTMALISGCGGGDADMPVLTGPVPIVTAPTITTQAVFANLSFTQPVALMQAPGDSTRWFVVEKAGLVRVFSNDQNTASTSIFIDIRGLVNDSLALIPARHSMQPLRK